MAWEVSIVAVEQDSTDGVAKVSYELTDGVTRLTKTERVSDVSKIVDLARLHVNTLEEQARLKSEIASPRLGKVSFEAPEPTPEEVEIATFTAALYNYRQLTKAVGLGLETQETLDAASAELKALYSRKHLSLL